MSRTHHLRRLGALACLTAAVSGGSVAMAANFGPVTFAADGKVRGTGKGTWALNGDLQQTKMRSRDKISNDGYSVFPSIDQYALVPSTSTSCDTPKDCSSSESQEWKLQHHTRAANLGTKTRLDRLETAIPEDAFRVKATHKICWDKANRPDKCGVSSTKRADL